MLLFRNPEIRKMAAVYAVFTLLAVFGAAFAGGHAAVCVLAVCVATGLLFLVFTARRYRRISELSEKIDQILHGEARTNFVPDEEGELALLTSQIYKMTVRLSEQTEQLQKDKEYLSSSIADISHQIRTPLTSMRMIIPRLNREELSRRQRNDYVREVNGLLSRIEWLITALLKLARLESGAAAMERVPVCLTEVVGKALAPLEIIIEIKALTVELSIPQTAGFTGDLLWSVEAVGNILKNCVEHLPDQGTLKIEASENDLYTELVISDDGPGICKEDLPHLFERFYKGKRSNTENAGIGLALSHMIITRQNGTIRAGNGVPCGAEFHIHFYKGAV